MSFFYVFFFLSAQAEEGPPLSEEQSISSTLTSTTGVTGTEVKTKTETTMPKTVTATQVTNTVTVLQVPKTVTAVQVTNTEQTLGSQLSSTATQTQTAVQEKEKITTAKQSDGRASSFVLIFGVGVFLGFVIGFFVGRPKTSAPMKDEASKSEPSAKPPAEKKLTIKRL